MSRSLALIAALLLSSATASGVLAQTAPSPPGVRPAPNSLGADWREQQTEARQGVKRGHLAPLNQVIAQIRRRTPGRQLDAGIEYRGERPVYRVRWVTTGGRRIDYIVDGATGAILSGG
ncbi:MAG TPA: PepSY domain-containing protein [Caulobacteraceae bacterium]|nr:PepSY domain-containing protein [Caulobacteraceae bacterium]